MWAYVAVQRSGRLVRPTATLTKSFTSSELSRGFSSDNNRDNRGGGRGGGGRGRGGGGRGGGGRGGGRGWNGKNNNNDGNNKMQDGGGRRGRRPKKQSFSEQFLEPAARGELKKHKSGIPKLSGRRPKGHGVRAADPLTKQDEMDFMEMEEGATYSNVSREKKPEKKGTIANGSPMDELNEKEYKKLMEFAAKYEALAHAADEENYYWNEVDYDDTTDAKRQEILKNLEAEATRDADGNLVVEVEDDVFAMFDEYKEKEVKTEEPENRRGGRPSPMDDVAFQFVSEAMGIKPTPPPANYNQVKPLQLSGPEMRDFVTSMMHHPTKYAAVTYESPHTESSRVPVPDIPSNRINPSAEFIDSNMRFMYVWGLPPLVVDGEPGDLENPLHRMEIQKAVSELFDLSIDQVSPATLSSAFVGFPNRQDQRFTVAVGPMETLIESPVSIEKYSGTEVSDADSCVVIQNLPSGYSPALIISTLFGEGSDSGEVFGKHLSSESVFMLSPHSAVIRFDSAETAESALNSTLLEASLLEIGQHRIRYSKARRELVSAGTHGGPDGTDPLKKLGNRLIVDGDMPTKDFYLSHAGSINLRNLDPAVTKEDIASFFQPFCSVPRDVEGSVEFVTCHEGLSTGRAYVGFDEVGEAEAALEQLASGGRIRGLGGNVTVAKLVKDAGKSNKEKRQTRSEEELLDSLHNWEQYVDPADLEELYDNGISKESLDETFRKIRYHNPTFASLDQAIRSETVNPEMDAGGMYRELVQTYVGTLKECLSTPENPGPIYESLFFEGEEIDTEIFEDESERQEELRQRREVP